MSSSSNNQGRAYEYAWIKVLSDKLNDCSQVEIIKNSSYDTNKKTWDKLSAEKQKLFLTSAKSAIDTLIDLEPMLVDNSGKLFIEALKDSEGIKGDVRDLIIKQSNWEIGLSIKHNSNSLKHSRISKGLDFGMTWYKVPCSKKYWQQTKPIFDCLEAKKAKRLKWKDVKNKTDKYYVPVLDAFIEEINYANKTDEKTATKLAKYILGLYDYHKIISNDNKRATYIQTFNMSGSLNKQTAHRISIISVPRVKLPTEIIAVKKKRNKAGKQSKTTVEIYMNNGWSFSFRLHNADKMVNASLKFDIKAIGMPCEVLNIECKWR